MGRPKNRIPVEALTVQQIEVAYNGLRFLQGDPKYAPDAIMAQCVLILGFHVGPLDYLFRKVQVVRISGLSAGTVDRYSRRGQPYVGPGDLKVASAMFETCRQLILYIKQLPEVQTRKGLVVFESNYQIDEFLARAAKFEEFAKGIPGQFGFGFDSPGGPESGAFALHTNRERNQLAVGTIYARLGYDHNLALKGKDKIKTFRRLDKGYMPVGVVSLGVPIRVPNSFFEFQLLDQRGVVLFAKNGFLRGRLGDRSPLLIDIPSVAAANATEVAAILRVEDHCVWSSIYQVDVVSTARRELYLEYESGRRLQLRSGFFRFRRRLEIWAVRKFLWISLKIGLTTKGYLRMRYRAIASAFGRRPVSAMPSMG